MPIYSKEVGNVLVVYFTDSRLMDESKIRETGLQLLALIDKCPNKRILLNFKNVVFLTSTMIGNVILLNRECKSSNVDLRLCDVSPGILQVFLTMRLDKLLNIQLTELTAFQP